jgi:uncharacterized protein (TIGR03083 family)
VTPREHYRSQRERITALVRELTDEQLATRVPGCPDWSVREVLAHLTAVPVDVAAGRLEGAGTPPWTGRQVAERQDWSLQQLLAEWDEHGPELEAALDGFGDVAFRFYWDATMHEDDVREALGLPLAEGPTQDAVLDGLVAGVGSRIDGLPPLRLHAGERTWVLCQAPPVTELRAPDAGELARALAGRRSYDRIRAMDWSGDPEPYLPHLTLFPPPA